MKTQKIIDIRAISQENLEVICLLLGFKFIGFDRFLEQKGFVDLIQVYFENDKIKDPGKALMIEETGEIYILFENTNKDNLAINTIPAVVYLKQKGLLLKDYLELEIMARDIGQMENAITAAKSLGKNEVPENWLAYLRAGWKIEQIHCSCGGSWAWLKPAINGLFYNNGCVCHHNPDVSRLLDTKQDSSATMHKLLTKLLPRKEDVGKIFYVSPKADNGTIVSRKDFLKLDPCSIGWWMEINEFHVI